MTSQDACTELELCKGGHFDPAVVDAFLRVVDRSRVSLELVACAAVGGR